MDDSDMAGSGYGESTSNNATSGSGSNNQNLVKVLGRLGAVEHLHETLPVDVHGVVVGPGDVVVFCLDDGVVLVVVVIVIARSDLDQPVFGIVWELGQLVLEKWFGVHGVRSKMAHSFS